MDTPLVSSTWENSRSCGFSLPCFIDCKESQSINLLSNSCHIFSRKWTSTPGLSSARATRALFRDSVVICLLAKTGNLIPFKYVAVISEK